MKFKFPSPGKISVKCRRFILLSLLAMCASNLVQASSEFADNTKVLRTIFPVAETGFDPAATRDLYSNAINDVIFDRLYSYDYLANPAKIIPQAAAALPEVSKDGKSYLIRLKKGIYFTPDPAFNNKARELIASDFVYSFKRLMDPKIASSHSWLFEDKVQGLNELRDQAKLSGKFDYDKKIAGFEVLDNYTLRINLTRPDYNLAMILAYTATSAVAREVIEKYADDHGYAMANPIGSGPYILREWVRGARMRLQANPEYRPEYWDFQASGDPADQKIIAAMKGKRMPQIGRIEVNVILEDQARLLAFKNDEADLFQLYGGLAPQMLNGDKLKPEYIARGIQLSRIIDPELTVYYFNMQDPVFGGLSKEKIALRRAIAMAHNVAEEIRVVDNGQGIALQFPIPPGVVGHDPDYRSSIHYNLKAANALLDKFGYKKGQDGYRNLPDGKPFEMKFTSQTESRGHLQAEVWKKTYDSLAIRMQAEFKPFSEILKAEKNCQLMQRISPWMADYPDGDNFMQLFYSKNIKLNNNGCVAIPEFDKLYEQTQRLAAGPERDKLYQQLARIMEVYSAQRLGYARYRNMLAQARVIGYKKHPIMRVEWLYLDLDKSK